MQKPRISAIAAIGTNRELGKNNELIWRISDDLGRLKALTTGHPIIMGRKTYESIGRPLPNRTNFVVTTDRNFTAAGCVIVHTLDDALTEAARIDSEEVFVFGGAGIYTAAFPQIERLYLTRINATDASADTFFPDYSTFTKEIACEERTDQKTRLSYEWVTLERE